MLEQSWYLAGIVRGTTDIFVEEVEYRNADTLTEVIVRSVAPGSILFTDEWAAYQE